MPNRIMNKKIIVTGASSGIGEIISWRIAANGGMPIMLARSIDKLHKQQSRIKAEFNLDSFVHKVDLQNIKELDHTVENVLQEHGQVHALINNAGTGMFAFVKDMAWEEMEQMFQLNVFALIRTTKLVLPHFLKHGEGHIINIASQAGKISTPKSAVYASTKHAVLGFTNSLRLEAAADNINVTSVNLGPVRTNFFKTADPSGSYQKNVDRYMLEPDKVAEKIVRHLFTAKREINLPFWMEFGSKLYHLFPQLMETVLKNQFNKK